MQVINTNIQSLNAQRNLSTSGNALSSALERLSSGLRINSAKDDAAGLAIATRFTTQINGLNQAVRNSNDGVSLAQTAESALQELTNNLQRIRELGVQSANATNSASDRAALDQEVQQRIAEIDRISSQTSFNGLRVLDGTFGTANFQVGANVGETISVNLSQGTRANQIGQIANGRSTAEVSTGALSGSGTIQVGSGQAKTIGASIAGTSNGQTVGSAFAKVAAINAAGVSGLTAAASNNVEFSVAAVAAPANGTDLYSLRINGVDVFAGFTNGSLTTQQISDSINAQSGTTGVTAALEGGNLRLSAADGRDIIVGQDVVGATATGGLTAGAGGATTVNGVVFEDGTLGTVANATAFSTDAAAVNGGRVTLSATQNIAVAGDGTALGFAANNITIAVDAKTLSNVNVLTVTSSNDAIQRVDSALTSVSSVRSSLGAIQNRFESTISNLQAVSQNLSASRSRIQDADFAAETAALSRAQILQTAGITVLSQANSSPQAVLQLLR